MFVDASAIVAILGNEPDKLLLRAKLREAREILVSAISIYEASLGLTRPTQGMLAENTALVNAFVHESNAKVVVIDRSTADLALEAFARYGKGRHRAALNMGDCFAYACAKMNRVPLLCKGDDFVHTDIRIA